MNEFEILDRFIRPLTERHPSSLHLTDDACILDKLNTKQFVATTDSITEGVHFLPNTSPQNIAHKLIAINLSDIAAMAAAPKYYLLSAILPKTIDKEWLHGFSSTLSELNKQYEILIVGGDTVRHKGPLSLSITMIGEVDKYHAITRSGAKEGDDIYATGTLGDSAIGLLIKQEPDKLKLSKEDARFFINRYELPIPRVEIGKKLTKIANSMIDISDGFIQDAAHIAKNSNVQLEINLKDIPVSQPLQKIKNQYDIIETVLTGGDDYELFFTAPEKYEGAIKEIASITSVPITKIGKVSTGDKIIIRDHEGKELKFNKTGYIH
jgi:thiamine-monophosphate kinase